MAVGMPFNFYVTRSTDVLISTDADVDMNRFFGFVTYWYRLLRGLSEALRSSDDLMWHCRIAQQNSTWICCAILYSILVSAMKACHSLPCF